MRRFRHNSERTAMKAKVPVLAAACAALALGARAADDIDALLGDDPKPAAAEAPAAEEGAPAAADGEALPQKGDLSKLFYLLPYCRELDGKGEVRMPGASEWKAVEEGKYYPLGSEYRCIGASSKMTIRFGPDSDVTVLGASSFSTRIHPIREFKRAINLLGGTILVSLPNNLPADTFTVNAPGFSVYNPAGRSRYTYKTMDDGEGDEALVRCVTQTMSIKGRHFDITGMKAANELRIRTSKDNLFTALYGKSGDIAVKLDQGRIFVKDFATGKVNQEDKFLDWRLSPETVVRIHRALPAIGERMSVTVMTFDSHGELKNRCAFAEGLAEVNSGELGPTSKKDMEELEKRAASLTDTIDADANAGAATTEEPSADAASPAPAPAKPASEPTPEPAPAPAAQDDGFGY